MYGVELYAAVRLAVVDEGLSYREAARWTWEAAGRSTTGTGLVGALHLAEQADAEAELLRTAGA